MFDSDLLDRLSRVHPMVPPLIFGPAIIALLVVGANGEPTTLQVIGLFIARGFTGSSTASTTTIRTIRFGS